MLSSIVKFFKLAQAKIISLSIFSENQMNFQLASTIEPNGNAQQNFRLGVTKVLGVLQNYLILYTTLLFKFITLTS